MMAHPLVLGSGSCPLPPTSLVTGHQWPCPSHPAVTQLTCHSPLCLRDFYSGFYSLSSLGISSTCVISLPVTFIHASCQHPKQDILVSVSPPGPTPLGLSSPDSLPVGQAPMLSCVGAIGGRARARQCVCKPQSGPLPWGITGIAALFRAKTLTFSSFSWCQATQEGRSYLTIDTSRDARLFHLALSKRGLRRPAFK